jgi:hypothetical protein
VEEEIFEVCMASERGLGLNFFVVRASAVWPSHVLTELRQVK